MRVCLETSLARKFMGESFSFGDLWQVEVLSQTHSFRSMRLNTLFPTVSLYLTLSHVCVCV